MGIKPRANRARHLQAFEIVQVLAMTRACAAFERTTAAKFAKELARSSVMDHGLLK
jgi:hypothetical protein